jgi:mRNA interferase MazF
VNPGDVVVVPLPTSAGALKARPALVLAGLPGPYGDLLLCGISTQLHLYVPDWDERLGPGEPDYAQSGLLYPSMIRLSYLGVAAPAQIGATLGSIAGERLTRLRVRLANLLQSGVS